MDKNNNHKKILIFVIIIIVLVTTLLVLLYPKEEEKPNNNISDDTNIVVEKDVYKTRDGRFSLKIVDKSDNEAYNKAKERYGENQFDDYINPYVVSYGYINNQVFAIDDILEDDNYIVFSLIGLPTESSGQKIMVNKIKGTIEVSDDDLSQISKDCLKDGFCGFQPQPSYIRTSTGYFFLTNNHGMITAYTANWKKIGYIDSMNNLKTDADGSIYVYENVDTTNCFGQDCDYKGIGILIKYDVNGKKK